MLGQFKHGEIGVVTSLTLGGRYYRWYDAVRVDCDLTSVVQIDVLGRRHQSAWRRRGFLLFGGFSWGENPEDPLRSKRMGTSFVDSGAERVAIVVLGRRENVVSSAYEADNL